MAFAKARFATIIRRYLPDDAFRSLMRELAAEAVDQFVDALLAPPKRVGTRPSVANDVNPEVVDPVAAERASQALARNGIIVDNPSDGALRR